MTEDTTDAQWELIGPLLPPPKRTGHPRADDRRTLDGILYVLRRGCRWRDLPPRYCSSVTCWRRLGQWQANGTWRRVWQSLLATLDAQGKLLWSRAFLDGTFVPAKGGPGDRPDPPRQRQQADAGGGWQRNPFGRDGGQCPKGGGPAGGAHPDHYPGASADPTADSRSWWLTKGTTVTPCASA